MDVSRRGAFAASGAALCLIASGALGRGAEDSRELAVLALSGSPRERGRQHGRALASEIGEGMARWKRALSEAHAMDAERFITSALESSHHLPAIRRWTPGLLEEVRGIAEGSGLDFESVLAFQLVHEIRAGAPAAASESSSTLGIAGDEGHAGFVAQNVDLEGFRDGFQTVLRIRESSGRESLVFTQAGLIALNGLNDRGVGVVASSLADLPRSSGGVPVAFAIRGILQRESHADASAFVKEIDHASGQSYILGGGGRVSELEASADGVVERAAPAGGRVVFRANHPPARSAESPTRRRVLLAGGGGPGNSEVRLGTLATRLSRYDRTPPLSLIEETLRSQDSPDHPICRPHRGDDTVFTFGSTIMQLSAAPELRVTAGPPDRHEYRAFRFD